MIRHLIQMLLFQVIQIVDRGGRKISWKEMLIGVFKRIVTVASKKQVFSVNSDKQQVRPVL